MLITTVIRFIVITVTAATAESGAEVSRPASMSACPDVQCNGCSVAYRL